MERLGHIWRAFAIVALAASAAIGSAAEDSLAIADHAGARVCVTTIHRPCAIRPHQLISGRRAVVRAIRWESWGKEAAIGKGRLRVHADDHGPAGPIIAKGRIKLYHLKRCGNTLWYTRKTIRYGQGFDRVYTRNAPSAICGRFPSALKLTVFAEAEFFFGARGTG